MLRSLWAAAASARRGVSAARHLPSPPVFRASLASPPLSSLLAPRSSQPQHPTWWKRKSSCWWTRLALHQRPRPFPPSSSPASLFTTASATSATEESNGLSKWTHMGRSSFAVSSLGLLNHTCSHVALIRKMYCDTFCL